MDKRRLALWADPDAPQPEDTDRPLLFLSTMAYATPNPDHTRKSCSNCFLWISPEECVIHEADVVTSADHVCDYHVFGKPAEAQGLSRDNMLPVQPQFSGLMLVPGGTSCDTCKHYQAAGSLGGNCGLLNDTEDLEAHPEVQALGCCNAWEERDDVSE